jgi:phage/plasmid-associated DNA primase
MLNQRKRKWKIKHTVKISALPLVGDDRIEFINTANEVFEEVLERLEPEKP